MPSVPLIVFDTLRKDAFEDHFDWLPGRRFERCFATANWAAPAHASLFTGYYLSETAVTAKAPALSVEQPVLAERLQTAGVTTRYWTANPNLSPELHFDRGFDEFVDSYGLPNAGGNVPNWAKCSSEHADDGLARIRKQSTRRSHVRKAGVSIRSIFRTGGGGEHQAGISQLGPGTEVALKL